MLHLQIPVGRLGEPDEVARVVEFLADPVSGPLIAAELVGEADALAQRAAMWVPPGWMMAVSFKLYRLARPAAAHP